VVQGLGHGAEVSGQQPGDLTQVQPLLAQLHSALVMLRIDGDPRFCLQISQMAVVEKALID
jgi:hypothetical protein